MLTYKIEILPHYSGMMCGHFPDWPGVSVLGRDHEDVIELGRLALTAEVERCLSEARPVPSAVASRGVKISVVLSDERVLADI